MIANPDGNLHIYMLSVGQGDTTVIVSPDGNVIIIDVMRPTKVLRLLNDLGNDNNIEHLVITHPHSDHFSGGNRLATDRIIAEATVAPFWFEFGMGPTTYRRLMGHLDNQGTNVTFLSGYSRWYPDGALTIPPAGQDPQVDENQPYLELLGPTNGLVRNLEEAHVFQTNHLSIICRLTWRNFRMIIAGDAQMENWSFFDHEHMLAENCQVLRTAHHGSANGTQWERIDRLSPSQVIVSSDPGATHDLPDLTGAAIFATFDSDEGQFATITRDSGTIHLRVRSGGNRTLRMFGDTPAGNVNLAAGQVLSEISNPTDWRTLVSDRIGEL
ncbi:MAG: ComEC/Rec2 family competence protein [Planctomycetota bacterium]|jgi:competence protein ComEC